MNLVKFCYKLLNETLVECYISDILFYRITFLTNTFLTSDQLWFKQQELAVSHFKFEVFTHQVAEVSTNFDLH